MSPLLNSLDSVATSINPSFSISDAWARKVAALEKPEEFLHQAIRVLRAEINQSYFDDRHYRKTIPEKLSLSYRQCRLLTELIGQVFTTRFALDNREGMLRSLPKPSIDRVVDEIADQGIVVLPDALSREKVATICETLKGFDFESRVTKQSRSGIGGDSQLDGAWWLKNTGEFANVDDIQRLAFDPTLLHIAQGVLGALPIHVQSNAWWTFPLVATGGESLERVQQRNAQWFHQDMEFIDFLKVFVYLTDVSETNGPHVYVRGSANDYEERLPDVQVSRRVSDQEIVQAFGADRVLSATGTAGTVLVANTRGYHKGAPVIEGHRLLLQFEYASSMYFNPVDAFIEENLVSEVASLRQKAPRAFMNYRPAAVPREVGWRRIVSRIGRYLPLPAALKRAA